jgi:hypothetical protein
MRPCIIWPERYIQFQNMKINNFQQPGLMAYNVDIEEYGNWVGGCGKIFLFHREKVALGSNPVYKNQYLSKSQANWTTARDTCCSLGMTLASIPTKGKKECLDRIMKGEHFTT